MLNYTVGQGSHTVRFYHRNVGTLVVNTGVDRIGWGYELNTANFPTYGGEVVQILSCFVSNLQVQGTIQTYEDMESIYTYFMTYFEVATQGDTVGGVEGKRFNQEPMKLEYPHRGWSFQIIPLAAPGYRKGREVVAPQWQIEAHVVDGAGDVEDLKELIISEAEIKTRTNNPDANFGLEGVIKFVDENPFSDPFTEAGNDYDPSENVNKIADSFAKLIPSYLSGDFDAVFGGIGSKPAFDPNPKEKKSGSANDNDDVNREIAEKQANKVTRVTNARGK